MGEMVASLKKPRRVMMLVKAGPAVDAFIEKLVSVERTILIINLQDELLMPHLREMVVGWIGQMIMALYL